MRRICKANFIYEIIKGIIDVNFMTLEQNKQIFNLNGRMRKRGALRMVVVTIEYQ